MDRYAPVIKGMPHMIHGGDYNPEQWMKWKDQIWKEDMRLAKLAGMNSLSVGIFSWSMLEPEEGEYHFEWLDEILDLMAENGMKAVLATPSAARPAWLSRKYPEVLRVQEDGIRNTHGGRHNYCMSSPVYRDKIKKLNTLLAKRYASHPALGLWHLSNEVNGECYCPLCQERFRNWLEDKYKTLDALNDAWWTTFWSHRYTDWQQIDAPSHRGELSTHGLVLDWKRFTTDLHRDFQMNEMAPLREFTPDVPCTSNLMAGYEGIDYVRYSDIYDIVSWDNYPVWRCEDEADIRHARDVGFSHDLIYGIRQRPFFLMESCPGAVNWHVYNKLPRPDVLKLQSMQAVAHGSDSVQYFQFRKSRGSSEKMHGAVVDHVGSEHTRVFGEVAKVGSMLQGMDDVVGTVKPSRVALIFDYQNNWALGELQGGQRQDKKYRETLLQHYEVFWKAGIPVDILDETGELDKYDLVAAPMAYMLREGFADRVKRFVERGGTFVTTYLSGYVNDTDLCFQGGFPGPLREIAGIWDEELDTLYPGQTNRLLWNDKEYEVYDYCERIHPEGAKVLATYKEDFYAGEPALTCHTWQSGRVYYIAARTGTDFLTDFYDRLMQELDIRPVWEETLPEGVSLQVRTDGKTDFCFLMNFTMQKKVFSAGGHEVVLEPHGTEVLKMEHR